MCKRWWLDWGPIGNVLGKVEGKTHPAFKFNVDAALSPVPLTNRGPKARLHVHTGDGRQACQPVA